MNPAQCHFCSECKDFQQTCRMAETCYILDIKYLIITHSLYDFQYPIYQNLFPSWYLHWTGANLIYPASKKGASGAYWGFWCGKTNGSSSYRAVFIHQQPILNAAQLPSKTIQFVPDWMFSALAWAPKAESSENMWYCSLGITLWKRLQLQEHCTWWKKHDLF